MSHVKFIRWEARMPNSDKLCNSFRAAEINGRLDFSLSLLAARGSVNWPCRMWPRSKELRLAKKSIALWQRSSAGLIPVKTGRLSFGVGRRYLVTMRKASIRPLSIRLQMRTGGHLLSRSPVGEYACPPSSYGRPKPICSSGRTSTVTDVLARPCKWPTPFSRRGDASKRIANKFRKLVILQLNIESLTASKMAFI